MSRIGKLPINIPDDVDVNYSDSKVTIKGKFGTLETKIPDFINITKDKLYYLGYYIINLNIIIRVK